MQHDGHTGHEHHGHLAEHSPAEHQVHAGHPGHQVHQGHHQDHPGGHGQHPHTPGGKVSWAMAARATLHCLTGCAIGEVLGMVIGTALGWGNVATMALAITLAFAFGYALTLRGILKAGVDFRTAFRVALAADTLSIAVMELIDNGVLALWPGAMDAHLTDAFFWVVLAFALFAAFLITTPVNKWMIGRGKGHAMVHQYHH
ncbi:DUF4396 domain-containing protein [Streptomyces sp. NRRL S-118]|uniref:DUF4396 domain-containing protein n=1 Tax=Streptomyces sp. NRRL S-118 TaxID=1463881 RepID=UPI0004C5351F|nr:DUF4396 domain-containing protein [Streptomyces sp. NRRL S-118]